MQAIFPLRLPLSLHHTEIHLSPPLCLLPMVHLRLMVLFSDCDNYLCPAAAAIRHNSPTRQGGQGQIALHRPLKACWEKLIEQVFKDHR